MLIIRINLKHSHFKIDFFEPGIFIIFEILHQKCQNSPGSFISIFIFTIFSIIQKGPNLILQLYSNFQSDSDNCLPCHNISIHFTIHGGIEPDIPFDDLSVFLENFDRPFQNHFHILHAFLLAFF
jgi:hypothetical protein